MTFRGYGPALGRFMQVDPLADIIPAINPYSFGFNNPVFFSDPLGLIGEGDDDRKKRRQEKRRARKHKREQRRAAKRGKKLGEFGGRRGSNNNDDSNQHTDPSPLFLGDKLDGVIIRGDLMTSLEAMRFDSDSNPIVRADRSGVTPRGRKISFGEGLGFETDFMKSVNAVKGGFFAAFTGIVAAPFVGSTLGTAALDGAAVYSAASLELNAISTWGYLQAGNLATRGAGIVGATLFGARGGYGIFGANGLRIANYRIDVLYANPASGFGHGTFLSIRQLTQGGALLRWNWGRLHAGGVSAHSTIRFYIFGHKFGSTAQRTWYPPFLKLE